MIPDGHSIYRLMAKIENLQIKDKPRCECESMWMAVDVKNSTGIYIVNVSDRLELMKPSHHSSYWQLYNTSSILKRNTVLPDWLSAQQ